ncbi:hypothetical protein MVI01_61600 [Myxococcus virescens]|uniref:Uncharacterized protein n=1 Tax=Myxococcus virescens TaxID=83456 RepID=A0A511HLB5_9BACT|nr:hypothetical protein MVI01_61600 [Myxococcus virescens]
MVVVVPPTMSCSMVAGAADSACSSTISGPQPTSNDIAPTVDHRRMTFTDIMETSGI